MKKTVLASFLGCFGLLALAPHQPSQQDGGGGKATRPAAPSTTPDKVFAYPPLAAQKLPPVASTTELASYLRTEPARIRAQAKTRNVVFMADCLGALEQHVRQFSMEGQRTGLTLAQLADNNEAFVQKVVADLRDGYDQQEAAEHKNDPKNPLTGKSIREEAEIYHCGLHNYLPLFGSLMAAKPVITILTQPDAAKVFLVQPTGYRSLGLSRLTKALLAGLYTLIFTKPGYQSSHRTFAAQRVPVQVFWTTLPPVAIAR